MLTEQKDFVLIIMVFYVQGLVTYLQHKALHHVIASPSAIRANGAKYSDVWRIKTNQLSAFLVRTEQHERFRITSGNIGIGTDNPVMENQL